MLNLQLARKYSRAFFLVAQEDNKLVEYGQELRAAKDALFDQADLKAYITSSRVQHSAKKDMISRIFEGEISEMTMNFLFLLVDKKRESLLEEITRAYEVFANEARGIVVADVTTALAIDDAISARLKAKLSEVTGKNVELRKHVDPAILGGVIVRMGDKRIDGSIVQRIKALRKELMAI